jgi:hypothetical protein
MLNIIRAMWLTPSPNPLSSHLDDCMEEAQPKQELAPLGGLRAGVEVHISEPVVLPQQVALQALGGFQGHLDTCTNK